MLSILISILILALIFGLIWYAIGLLPLPAPFGNIIKVILVVIFVLMLLAQTGLISGLALPTVMR